MRSNIIKAIKSRFKLNFTKRTKNYPYSQVFSRLVLALLLNLVILLLTIVIFVLFFNNHLLNPSDLAVFLKNYFYWLCFSWIFVCVALFALSFYKKVFRLAVVILTIMIVGQLTFIKLSPVKIVQAVGYRIFNFLEMFQNRQKSVENIKYSLDQIKIIKNKRDANQEKSECDEQLALTKAKKCTYLVMTNLAHGTGFAIDPNHLVTNKHVIDGANSISTWVDMVETNLSLWNYAENADIAILKSEKPLFICNWADSDQIALAETLYAVGWPNSPDGDSSITRGIFSRYLATDEGPQFIQTDAAINPGNSGGPLLNQCGIVGINTGKVAWSEQDVPAEGFSFAISSNYAKTLVPDLITNGDIKELPVDLSQTEYSLQDQYFPQDEDQKQNSNNGERKVYIDPEVKESWLKARDVTREMEAYWQSHTADVDQVKLATLKDLIARMMAVVDTIVPKIENSQSLSEAEQDLLAQWNEMYKQAIVLEGELHGRDYSQGYYHYQCENNSCVAKEGRGMDSCDSGEDCLPEYHYECQNMACTLIKGEGENNCSSHKDCYYYQCNDNQCIKVEGNGTDECYLDWQCASQ
ncbi:MAG: trypsin-like peptidase domain-containing protein [Patescibacteria group bacterium]|nr:trypsin-like peptidase domain-containing protein [Patescibacteria group bacterium]